VLPNALFPKLERFIYLFILMVAEHRRVSIQKFGELFYLSDIPFKNTGCVPSSKSWRKEDTFIQLPQSTPVLSNP
jgi:hypothetical protein